jgi:hypothetical protein
MGVRRVLMLGAVTRRSANENASLYEFGGFEPPSSSFSSILPSQPVFLSVEFHLSVFHNPSCIHVSCYPEQHQYVRAFGTFASRTTRRKPISMVQTAYME